MDSILKRLQKVGLSEEVEEEEDERAEPINEKTLSWKEVFEVADKLDKIPCPKQGNYYWKKGISCNTCQYRKKCKKLEERYNKMLKIMGKTIEGKSGNREK